jgi:hypothetical protein
VFNSKVMPPINMDVCVIYTPRPGKIALLVGTSSFDPANVGLMKKNQRDWWQTPRTPAQRARNIFDRPIDIDFSSAADAGAAPGGAQIALVGAGLVVCSLAAVWALRARRC